MCFILHLFSYWCPSLFLVNWLMLGCGSCSNSYKTVHPVHGRRPEVNKLIGPYKTQLVNFRCEANNNIFQFIIDTVIVHLHIDSSAWESQMFDWIYFNLKQQCSELKPIGSSKTQFVYLLPVAARELGERLPRAEIFCDNVRGLNWPDGFNSMSHAKVFSLAQRFQS